MARAVLIANPNAARTQGSVVREIEQIFRAAGWQLEVLATGGPGDATRLAAYGVEQGVDVVAVFGGDGTTMQAASALVGSGTALGLIPGGTGNLLAGNLRLPSNPLRAVEALVRGVPRALDLGLVTRPGGNQYFAVAAGAGMDARVMSETPSLQKHKWGMMAYLATTFRLMPELRSLPFHLTIDGVVHDAEAAMVLVANCGEVIPRLIRLGHGITPHDGLLDVVVVRANSVGQGVRAVWDLLTDASGTFGKDVMIGFARGREIRVELAGGEVQPVQMDGDPGGETPFTATAVPEAIQVMMPRT